ncbi:calcium/sodium:proton antiporter [Marinomonas sp. SBI22]|uniref:calcium/sodium antiporter n=1 Tax=unclassified Marinomonas TaxID=196814 RepID=UPI0005F9EEFA|nr:MULTISPECIES: calcium/sodium antiporter [unclassified Marinomonas]KJZ14495.1 calcium/sodium:proton antiporter [Marinomonas sp. S3726]KZM41522.1 calcium/sodium:proton antiporter [Marinomonas sp. SBI22]KZM43358.1 calcium/sodium:proton antiporter [Marinomonas sp. SBI8L]
MLLFSAALFFGLILLVFSSDKFIEHSALVAEKLNVSPIVIGFTLVALGTSAPEMVVSAIAALDGAPEIAVGNVLGSNIANVALVFGATLLISAIPIKEGLATKEVPILLGITILAGLLMMDNSLEFLDGIILIIAFFVALFLLLRNSKGLEEELTQELPEDDGSSVTKSLTIAVIGLAVLILSSKILVWGATGIAVAFGVSELLIGLTIIAIGTSLPELAASITSALKGHHDIAIGNILGSNLFNLATVLPLPAIIAPGLIDPNIMGRDYWWMFCTSLFLALCILIFRRTKSTSIPKWIGIILLISYATYLISLFLQAR